MFDKYAEVYDLLYREKDYPGECDFIEALFRKYRKAPVRSILDVSAGTGNHALVLAQRGYAVSAFDYSPEMAKQAEAKARKLGLRVDIQGGISMAELPPAKKTQDAVVSLFASINYLTKTVQIEHFLACAKEHLSDDGLLIFDYWNGIACLKDYFPERTKEVSDEARTVARTSTTQLHKLRNEAEIDFRFRIQPKAGKAEEFREKHTVRYFFPREVSDLLEKQGYELLAMLPFKDAEREITDSDWYVTAVARKG